MDAHAFRHFYDYHFSENRHIWDDYIMPLSFDQFTQPVDYSRGSVRDQVVHIINADEGWFSTLRGAEWPKAIPAAASDDRQLIRSHWDGVEQDMRSYLAGLHDDLLLQKPFAEGEDKDLILWQVLLHVANHGTDHRAQLLRLLHDIGVKTLSQDYIFYVYDHPS